MRLGRFAATAVALAVAFFMIISPQNSVAAALAGLELWAKVLVPALLPFFMVAEILVALGFAAFLGRWLEPLIRPAFKLPGSASLVIVMGFCAGFPMGAVLSRRLNEEGLLSRAEAERVCGFTNNSSPLFIIGAVGVGMFGSAAVGYLLAGCHYLSNLCVGLLLGRLAPAEQGMRRYRRREMRTKGANNASGEKAGFNPGALMADAVKNSVNSILAVGGFVLLFSVVTACCRQWGLMEWLAAAWQGLLAPWGASLPLAAGITTGLFEISLGAQAVSAAGDPLGLKLTLLSAVFALGGLSILAQVISAAAAIPVRTSFYLKCRLLQAVLATAFCAVALHFIGPDALIKTAALLPPSYKMLYTFDVWRVVGASALAALTALLIMLFAAWLCENRQKR
ncbi:MAG: nucleoside recognition domain-containing protein [Syntrophomonadaceae bacterium]|nr:nucleoside recognition domain-containing protein [Syntrophomonadaceae bacterium]